MIPCYHLRSQRTHIRLPQQVRSINRSLTRLRVPTPSQPTGHPFGAQLKEVFPYDFPRASHQPAAFCLFPHTVLILIIAFAYFQ